MAIINNKFIYNDCFFNAYNVVRYFITSTRSDLPANELVQRHKISSRGSSASITSISSMSGGVCGSPTMLSGGQGTMSSQLNLSNSISSSTNSSGLATNNGRHTLIGIMPSSARSSPNIAAATSPHKNLTLNISAVFAVQTGRTELNKCSPVCVSVKLK